MQRIDARLMARLCAVAILVGALGAASDSEGQRRGAVPGVAIGGLVAQDAGSAGLRDALSTELSRLGSVHVTGVRRARYLVGGAVTRIERRRVAERIEVHCEVSLVVAERRGGSIRMVLSGQATAAGAGATDALERSALHAAVRGALRPLGGSLVALR